MKIFKLFALITAGLAFSIASLSASTQLAPDASADEILAAIEVELGTNCENVNTRRLVQAVLALARANPERVGDIVAVAVACKPSAAVALAYETVRVYPNQAADIVEKIISNNPDAAGPIIRIIAPIVPEQAPTIIDRIGRLPGLNPPLITIWFNEGLEQGPSILPITIPELTDLEFDSDSNNPSPSGL